MIDEQKKKEEEQRRRQLLVVFLFSLDVLSFDIQMFINHQTTID